MLNKLNIATLNDDDLEVFNTLEGWSVDSSSMDSKRVDKLLSWYNEKGLNSEHHFGNIYKGMIFEAKHFDFDLLLNSGYLKFKKSWGSWSADPIKALEFSWVNEFPDDYVGAFVSHKLNSRDKFFELNNAYEWFVENANFLVKNKYKYECEIAVVMPCEKCQINENLECLVVFGDSIINLIEKLNDSGWKVNDDEIDKTGLSFVFLRKGTAIIYNSISEFKKNLHRKSDTRC